MITVPMERYSGEARFSTSYKDRYVTKTSYHIALFEYRDRSVATDLVPLRHIFHKKFSVH